MKLHERELKKLLLPPTATIREAFNAQASAKRGIILVIDDENHLLGVVVDSDIRRAFLEDHDMETPLKDFMNFKPFTLAYGTSDEDIRTEFNKHPRSFIPLIDQEGHVRDLAWLGQYMQISSERANWVFLVAGGFGTRLRPMTNECPKPMLYIGDRPIMETMIIQLVKQGFTKFMIAVNHLGNKIKDHFRNGSRWGAVIEYIDEKERMGTAGALSFVSKKLKDPLIVMNADLLTNVDCNCLLEFHRLEGGKATTCVKEYNIQIPFGVVIEKNGRMVSLDEKPVQKFFVNAGIYVFEPDTLSLLEPNQAIDMPLFLEKIDRQTPDSVACFPITEYWLDIGRIDDYEKAKKDYEEIFKK